MNSVLIAGAGKSSIYLIKYMLTIAPKYKWTIVVADFDKKAAADKIGDSRYGKAVALDINNNEQRWDLVEAADMVISLMPPNYHILLAKDCIEFKKNFVFSSYISDELRALEPQVKAAGLVFMGEMGLDPGIDHMSAGKIINSIQRVTGRIVSFRSYCGGLVAPSSDDNPWHYKFTWNPKNVVTAGFGGAKYLSNGKNLEIAYEHMFEHSRKIKVDDTRTFAYYPNRDSLRYLDLYHVPDIKTFMRATLRHPQFCKGWNAMISLGLTNQQDHFTTEGHTYNTWVRKVTGCPEGKKTEAFIADKLMLHADDKVMTMLSWLGLFTNTPVRTGNLSSADILLDILLEKWDMKPEDKDMVVMSHEVEYLYKDNKIALTSYMIVEGENKEYSAMAKTVGLPIAIYAKLFMNGKIKLKPGIHIPIAPEVYRPLLTELAHHGISFIDEVR